MYLFCVQVNHTRYIMAKETFYQNNKMTIRLEESIKYCESFLEFEQKYSDEFLNEDCRIGNYLRDLIDKYNKKDSVVSIEAGLNHSYVGNIINGRKNNPSRNALICICFALGTSLEEVQYLLKYGGHAPLYVRKKRDVIIWFGFMKHESLDTVNTNLVERGFSPLYKEK